MTFKLVIARHYDREQGRGMRECRDEGMQE
jgi:hypothetical protein